jgi:Holliday junction resolvase
MSKESLLWKSLKNGVFEAEWTRIENRTGGGIPDVFGCYKGVSIWVELKQTKYYKVLLSPLQVSWHFRHARVGGISYILVKKQCESLFKRALYLYRGKDSLILAKNGLKYLPLKQFDYPYDWNAIRDALFKITELSARELLNQTHANY